MLLLSLTLTASADTLFGEVSEPSVLGDSNGTWPRMLPRGDGTWWFLHARGGTLTYQPYGADLLPVPETQAQKLMSRTDLTDHAIVVCSDGTWLDAASSAATSADDSIYLFRFQLEDLAEVGRTLLVWKDDTYVYNDPPALCTDGIGPFATRGEIEVDSGEDVWSPFYLIDEAVGTLGTIDISPSPVPQGGSWVVNEAGTVATLVRSTQDLGMTWTRFDIATHEPIEQVHMGHPLGESNQVTWPSAAIRFGQHYWVAGQGHPDGAYSKSTGEVYIMAFDEDWELVESLRVTDLGGTNGSSGAFQLGMTEQDGLVIVTYTQDAVPYMVTVDQRPIWYAPTVEAGPDQEVVVGTEATVQATWEDGSESEETTVTWSLTSAPDGSTSALLGEGDQVSVVPDLEGDYVLQVDVVTPFGSATDSLTVTAVPQETDSDPPKDSDETDDTQPEGDDSEPDSYTPEDPGCSGCNSPAGGSGAAALLMLVGLALLRRRATTEQQQPCQARR